MADLPKPPLRRRRIIERPRLIRALDRSQARVRMLVAGAGYGKTTLAEQWARDRELAWVRARRSSSDVAVLARQLAAAGERILPGSGRRLTERLNATTDPAAEVDILIDLLSEDLAPWPEGAWIAIDDYHHLRESAIAEAFVEGVVQQSEMHILIASRDRPSWVSTRSVLYGEALEIGQTMLAMSEEEVSELLGDARDGMSSGLLALAGGWPAVVALASVSPAEPALLDDRIDMPEQLFEFFADEVYKALQPDSQLALGLLATAPALDRDLASELIGSERAANVCAEALGLGVLEEREGRLEFHPLAAAFLEQQARRERAADIAETVSRCLSTYRARGEWDAAFELVERYGDDSDFESLVSDALGELLNEGRLATMEAWIERGRVRKSTSPILSLARAELALREGKHLSAETFAQAALSAAGESRTTAWRAAMVAGRAAHSGSREESALEFYRAAESLAGTPRQVREALWGQLAAASTLELSEAHELVDVLEASMDQSDRYELVRMADRRLGLEMRFGAIVTLADARHVEELVGGLEDPFVRCSFRSIFAHALVLSASYEDAYDQALLMYEDASAFRLDPVLPYAHLSLANAQAGFARYSDAHLAVDDAIRESRRCNDEFGLLTAYMTRVRILVQQGRAGEACALEVPDTQRSLPTARAELLASRGLALATVGRLAEARSIAGSVLGATQSVEVRVLAPAIAAVCSVRERSTEMRSSLETLVRAATDSGGLDLLVTAYRGNGDLLEDMLASPLLREHVVRIMARAGDDDLLEASGLDPSAIYDPVVSLSPREREVYELLCDGLGNGDIARRLFITEGTVKVHVHHIFDKLGVRSRTALAINAARTRRADVRQV